MTANIAKGGKSIYGAPLGILMLEARFPRIAGDMGNGATWPFPVLFRVVRGASPERVVLNGATGLLQDFVAAATDLVDLGADTAIEGVPVAPMLIVTATSFWASTVPAVPATEMALA